MNPFTEQVRSIKNQSILIDMALGFEPEIEVSHKWDRLAHYKRSGFHYLGLALAGEFTSLETTIRYIARHRAKIQSQPESYIIVNTVNDIHEAKLKNKLALGFWLQGSHPLQNDINMVQIFYQLGIRYILLCYNTQNAVGSGVVEKNDGGLSQFGYKLIEEMNRVGMLIDLSHAGIKTSLDAMENSCHPVIFSHSNAYGVVPHIRNLTDEQILALARTGGVIGMNSMALFLGSEKSSVKKMVDHIDYIVDLIGTAENISLGLDSVYFSEVLDLFYQKAGITTYPNNYLGSMDTLQPEKIDKLIEELLNRKYSLKSIQGILGENFLRVASQVWK